MRYKKEGIYNSDNCGSNGKGTMPLYIKDDLAAWLSGETDWLIYFYNGRGCWDVGIEARRCKEIIIDGEMLRW